MYYHRRSQIIQRIDAFREALMDATSEANLDALSVLEETLRDILSWTSEEIHHVQLQRQTLVNAAEEVAQSTWESLLR